MMSSKRQSYDIRRHWKNCLFLVAASQWHHHRVSCLYLTATTPPGGPPVSSFSSSSNDPTPASIANVGGTVPGIVLDAYDELHQQRHPQNQGHHHHHQQQQQHRRPLDPFFWTEQLDRNASQTILKRYQQAFPDQTQAQTQSITRNTISSCKSKGTPFSLLTWNILSQQLYDTSTTRRTTSSTSSSCCDSNRKNAHGKEEEKEKNHQFTWQQRLGWILDTLSNVSADVVCLQEVDYPSFENELLPAMQRMGYDGAVQGGHNVQEIKRRKGKSQRAHVVATLWKRDRFAPVDDRKTVGNDPNASSACMPAILARGRTLTCLLQDKGKDEDAGLGRPTLAVINCHLEGHPNQYAARIKQLQHAMDDLVARCDDGVPIHGLCIAGDFNCELQSSACSTYLRIGRVGRKGGLGGVHGTSALVIPPVFLESDEAAECLGPILEWGRPVPNEELETVQPHPFRRNSLRSAYPSSLGQTDPRQHFTFCANPNRPVAGLDQIWFSGYSMTRLALRKPLSTPNIRARILATGLPAPKYPSDHLPIGTILDWIACDPTECSLESSSTKKCTNAGVRELTITPKQAPPTPKSKSPIIAYAELDMLLVTCPFDSEMQRKEMEAIVEYVPDLPPNNQKPSAEQLHELSEMRKRKQALLMGASGNVRQILQRILKLKKEVSSYEVGV